MKDRVNTGTLRCHHADLGLCYYKFVECHEFSLPICVTGCHGLKQSCRPVMDLRSRKNMKNIRLQAGDFKADDCKCDFR